MRTIKNAKPLEKKSRVHRVRHVWGNLYQVISGTSGRSYNIRVHDDGAACDCKWGTKGGNWQKVRSGCSHVQAVFDYLEAQKGRRSYTWTDPDQAVRQHRPITHIGDGVTLTSRKV